MYIFVEISVFMEKKELHNISLAKLKSLFPDSPSVGLGDDFYILDARLTDRHSPLQHPCRFDGFMILYCCKGHIRLNINLNEYELKENMMFVNSPGNIIKVNELIDTDQNDMRYLVVAMSKEFISGLALDANKMFNYGLSLINNPFMSLDDENSKLLGDHLRLITDVVNSGIQHKADVVRTLISSLLYVITGMWTENIVEHDEKQGVSSRGRMVFEQFMKLVNEYHTQYRNVGFYADKLCLTPKYLSKLVKNASGRSAPDWIDAYVILEAKNLLKHSNISIKEIVFRLNFPNQSVFYKFFKARTGMTPSEYRNS